MIFFIRELSLVSSRLVFLGKWTNINFENLRRFGKEIYDEI